MPRITPVPGRRLRRVFELAGFQCVRVEGDHFVLTRPGLPRPLVVPDYDAVPVFIIRNNLRTARMSREEYFRLLEQTCRGAVWTGALSGGYPTLSASRCACRAGVPTPAGC